MKYFARDDDGNATGFWTETADVLPNAVGVEGDDADSVLTALRDADTLRDVHIATDRTVTITNRPASE